MLPPDSTFLVESTWTKKHLPLHVLIFVTQKTLAAGELLLSPFHRGGDGGSASWGEKVEDQSLKLRLSDSPALFPPLTLLTLRDSVESLSLGNSKNRFHL